ncbi:hypothetical protein BCR44DRAFT_307307 [Catenaria anguillulae PL171]|uniref:Uncharacterized protein n=1 Tax=Catenaria anguillulae PL171 TaxID=765915 RepID=A0A1Y2HUI9_9FUNG|nr:hypothetical protein BCR44DRAFT_307307 [Catenaria anguillulae PL171]
MFTYALQDRLDKWIQVPDLSSTFRAWSTFTQATVLVGDQLLLIGPVLTKNSGKDGSALTFGVHKIEEKAVGVLSFNTMNNFTALATSSPPPEGLPSQQSSAPDNPANPIVAIAVSAALVLGLAGIILFRHRQRKHGLGQQGTTTDIDSSDGPKVADDPNTMDDSVDAASPKTQASTLLLPPSHAPATVQSDWVSLRSTTLYIGSTPAAYRLAHQDLETLYLMDRPPHGRPPVAEGDQHAAERGIPEVVTLELPALSLPSRTERPAAAHGEVCDEEVVYLA